MKFNKKVIELLGSYGDDGLLVLLSIKHNLSPKTLPDSLMLRVLSLGIVSINNGKTVWNYDLFAEDEGAFEWVKTEYEPLFSNVHRDKGGNVKDCIGRMKKFFAENPSLRKDDVLEGTRLYIRAKDPMYIREARYFISKGTGSAKTSDLLHWATLASETNLKIIPTTHNNIMN